MNNRYYNRIEREYEREMITLARKATIKRQYITLIIMFVVVVFSVMFLYSGRVYADSSNGSKVKMYKSVLVYSGDSLETIANQYITEEYSSNMKYIKEVASINGISENSHLTPGNHIIVPYYTVNPDIVDVNNVAIANPTISISVY